MQLAQILANEGTGPQRDIQTDRRYEDGKGNLLSALRRNENDCTCLWGCVWLLVRKRRFGPRKRRVRKTLASRGRGPTARTPAPTPSTPSQIHPQALQGRSTRQRVCCTPSPANINFRFISNTSHHHAFLS